MTLTNNSLRILESELEFLDLEGPTQYMSAQDISGNGDWFRARMLDALYTGETDVREILDLLYL